MSLGELSSRLQRAAHVARVEQQEQHTGLAQGLAQPSCHRSQAALQGRRPISVHASAATIEYVGALCYIFRRFTTGNPSDEPPWLPNKEMTKLCEISDETSTDRFPHFQCLTLQCDPSTLNLRLGGRVGSPSRVYIRMLVEKVPSPVLSGTWFGTAN